MISEAIGERRVRLSVPGSHNVANALVAIGSMILARELDPGLPPLDDLIDGLAGFPGMARRLQSKGRRRAARSSTTTTPTIRPRSRPRSRRCASCRTAA